MSSLIGFHRNVGFSELTFRRAVHSISGSAKWWVFGKEKKPKDFLRSKYAQNKLFTDLQLDCAKMFGGRSTVEDLIFPKDCDFVVKPDFGVGSHGVFVVVMRNGLMFDLKGVELVEEDLRSQIQSAKEKKKIYKKWVVEERLFDRDRDGAVTDYKFYCFRGKCPLLLAKLNYPNRYAWLSDRFDIVDVGEYNDRFAIDFAPPSNLDAMWGVAQQISRLIPLPFCRIDLYNTTRGVVIGELTPAPGRPEYLFNEQYERLLLEYLDYGISDLRAWQGNEVFRPLPNLM